MNIKKSINIKNLFSTLLEIERVYGQRHNNAPFWFDELAEIYPLFEDRLQGFSIFQIYLCLRSLPRFPFPETLSDSLEQKISEALKDGNLIKKYPHVQEAAAGLFDFLPHTYPDEDYTSVAYWGIENQVKDILDYRTFCSELRKLHSRLFCHTHDYCAHNGCPKRID